MPVSHSRPPPGAAQSAATRVLSSFSLHSPSFCLRSNATTLIFFPLRTAAGAVPARSTSTDAQRGGLFKAQFAGPCSHHFDWNTAESVLDLRDEGVIFQA